MKRICFFLGLLSCITCHLWANEYCTHTTLFQLTKNRVQEAHPDLFQKLEVHATLSEDDKILLEKEMLISANEIREKIFTFFKQRMPEKANNIQGCVDYSMATAYVIEKGGLSPEIAVEKTLASRPLELREKPGEGLRYAARSDNDVSIFWTKDNDGVVRFNGEMLSDMGQMQLRMIRSREYIKMIKTERINAFLRRLLSKADADLLTAPSSPAYVVEKSLPTMQQGDVGIIIAHYVPETSLAGTSETIDHAIAVQKITDTKWIIFDNLANGARIEKIPLTEKGLTDVFTSVIEQKINEDNASLHYLKALKESDDFMQQIEYDLGFILIAKSPMGRLLDDEEKIIGYTFSSLRLITKTK